MSILSRAIFREIAASAILGSLLFTFVLFLRSLRSLFELLVRGSSEPETVAYLASLIYIPTLTFAIPVGVLVGILIALSRASTDNEITAMRACGVPARRLLTPVLSFAFLGLCGAAASSLWLTPWSIRETYRIVNRLLAVQLTAEIQPQVFDEQFPNTILYVGDVIPGPVVRWRNVFLADLTPPEERNKSAASEVEGPRVVFAQSAIALADPGNNRIQLSMQGVSTFELGKDPQSDHRTVYPRGDQILEAQKRTEARAKPFVEIDTLPLAKIAYDPVAPSLEARIELHQRLAPPFAAIVFALIGLPLGVSQRRSGKSAAVVIAVLVAFAYWMSSIALVGLARQRTLPVEAALWFPNLVLLLIGIVLFVRLEHPGDADFVGRIQVRVREWFRSISTRLGDTGPAVVQRRWPLFPQVVDTYVLNSFLFYLALWLMGFLLLTEVFTFFELLSDIIKNQIPMSRVLTYLWFLAPRLIYDITPLSVMIAVLVTFGVMTKNNEITAMKACGVSLHRLALPVLLSSAVLSGSLFAFDYYQIPEANRKQDAIRNEIKGKPPATFLRADRKYIKGEGSRIYYYRYFEPAENVMLGVSIYEIDPTTFRLQSVIVAEKARWEPNLKTWVFQNGSRRVFTGIKEDFHDFSQGAMSFSHLNEPPSYFLKEVKLSSQMNFRELSRYMRDLQTSGFDTTRLQVQYHNKFSVPVFTLIMALLATPFAFLTGNRGAMAGVGVSLGIGLAYLTVNKLFEQVGNVNQLPAPVAAWAPDAVFSLAGLYLFLRMRT